MVSTKSQPIRLSLFLLVMVLVFFTSSIALGAVLCVDGEVATSGNGTCWSAPYKTIQEAIDAATEGDEIWIKAGVYFVDATINVDEVVALYGGFGGWEREREQRDWEAGTSVMGDEGVRCFNISSDAVLDGLGISGVYAVLSGGGITSSAENLTINNCSFFGNLKYYDEYGAAINFSGENLTITNSTFELNDAASCGAILSLAENLTITNCSFGGNWALSGGGAMCLSGKNVTITNCSFGGNIANGNETGNGGAILSSAENLTITNCHFSGNQALGWGEGGAIKAYGVNLTITNSTFSGNYAFDGSGGGILSYVDNLTITNSTFDRNYSYFGGGIAFGGENATITSCNFYENDASSGAGIYSSGNSTITNSTFADNSSSYGGGGIASSGENITITNCTFAGNVGVLHGGGIAVGGENSTITNTILWGNSAPEGPQIFDYYSSATVTYCNIDQDGYEGNDGNIREEPLFVDVTDPDPINWDLHLQPNSPCIDEGTENAPALPDFDFEGDPRIYGSAPDIGADEYVPFKIESEEPLYIRKEGEAWESEGRIVGLAEGPTDFTVTVLNSAKEVVKTVQSEKLEGGLRAYDVWLEPGTYILLITAEGYETLDLHGLEVMVEYDLRIDLEFSEE